MSDQRPESSAANTTRPTLVGPLPKFPKVRCDSCGQIYFSTAAVYVPYTKSCPTCGSGSFSSSFTVEQAEGLADDGTPL